MIHNKYWQAFFAIGPILFAFIMILGYFGVLLSFIGEVSQLPPGVEPGPGLILQWAIPFFIVLGLIVLLSLASFIFYIVHAVQNPNLKQGSMLLVWIILFIFLSGLGQFIYWLVEIVSKKADYERF
ncbi:hypothetical protein [Eudoraea chungangensis]|uniref:hypothetical protein n=1 Tax=Eudoraea chungangensis TaxID=1481905 RepID=UPI0023ECC12F|nr:hypothetical protein [Eudoraea chungangensis]